MTSCSEWVYDTTVMKRNLVTEVSSNHSSIVGHVTENWFIVSSPQNPLMKTYVDVIARYCSSSTFSGRAWGVLISFISHILSVQKQ